MNSILAKPRSPLERIDLSFAHYVAERKREEGAHMSAGIPDYSFDLDYELRSKLGRIPHFEALCRKINATIETRMQQILNQGAIAVGPTQYADIYNMGLDCARRLGIGIPNIYISTSSEMNAFTYASDSTSPVIVLYTGIIDRMTPGELKCVIAHECGHIHNRHLVYQRVIQKLLNSGKGALGVVLSVANIAIMQFWTRAAEVTADRAALICADDPQDAVNVQAKLLSGGTINEKFQQEFDINALREQMEMTFSNPTRVYEVLRDHPSPVRRIFATEEFEKCDIYYRWRPEMLKPGFVPVGKAEIDERCKKLVNIVSNC